MKKTKLKIIQTSIALFNEFGFANVSLQQIARNLNLSSGNLTYHFPRREDLMETVYDYFVVQLQTITNAYQDQMDFAAIDDRVKQFYYFQKDFRFFYVDLLEIERAFPLIAKKHYQHIDQQIKGISQMLEYNSAEGHLHQYASTVVFQQLARQIWMTTVFWQIQLLVQGKTSTAEDLAEAVWMLLCPHFTPQGKKLYQQLATKIDLPCLE